MGGQIKYAHGLQSRTESEYSPMGRASRAARRSSLIFMWTPKGHACDRVGHYRRTQLLDHSSSSSTDTKLPRKSDLVESGVTMYVDRIVCVLCACVRVCVCVCACHCNRWLSTAENVPRGPRLLDDNVLQHHPLPLHLLQHLQPVPADGRGHGVRRLRSTTFHYSSSSSSSSTSTSSPTTSSSGEPMR